MDWPGLFPYLGRTGPSSSTVSQSAPQSRERHGAFGFWGATYSLPARLGPAKALSCGRSSPASHLSSAAASSKPG